MTDIVPPLEIIPISLGFVNAYLVKQEGIILIDTGIPGSALKIFDTMKVNGIKPENLSLIILTHGHQDHAGSVSAIRERTTAPVLSHVNTAELLQKGVQGELQPCSMTGHLLKFFFSMKKHSTFPPFKPDILIDAPYNLSSYGISGMVIPTPGHAKGSLSVALDSGERFTGDLIFPKIPSGKPGLPFWADEPDKILPSIRTIADDNATVFYPGHGGPFMRKDVLELINPV